MSQAEQTVLIGAASGRVEVIAIGSAATTISKLMADRKLFDLEVTVIGVGDAEAVRPVAGLTTTGSPTRRPATTGSRTAGLATRRAPDESAASAVLIIADTRDAGLVAQAIEGLAAGRESTSRRRIWPVFTTGDPAQLMQFDARLDELADAHCDAILMLTQAPGPDSAADALLSWLTVKLPAPASVLGRLPDASGRTCRYVALGMLQLDAPCPDDLGTGTGTVAIANKAESAGEEASEKADKGAIENESAAAGGSGFANCQERFLAAIADLPAYAELCHKRAAIDSAIQATDLTAVIEARQQLIKAADVDVMAQLRELADDVIAAGVIAVDVVDSASLENALDAISPETTITTPPVTGNPADAATEADSASIEALGRATSEALAQYLIVAGKTGLGRMVSGGRRRACATNLGAAADAFVEAVIAGWVLAGEPELRAAAAATAQRVRQEAETTAAATQAARASAATAEWRARVSGAVAEGATWQSVEADRVVRTWGSGAAAARRYVIGSGELLDTVVDLTDGSAPCLRVVTQTKTAAVTVLTAQYGLPLSALV